MILSIIKSTISVNILLISNILNNINKNNVVNSVSNKSPQCHQEPANTEHPCMYTTVTTERFYNSWIQIQITGWGGKQWRPAQWHLNVRRSQVNTMFRLSVSGCTSSRQVSLGSSMHTFWSYCSVPHTFPLFNTVHQLCILHMSNLVAVIGQFCQDECLSKCPWQRSI